MHARMDTGGRAKDGTPVITCSAHLDPSAMTELKEKEALDLFLHFSTLPRNGNKAKGITIIINGATLTLTAMTTLLQAVGKFQVGRVEFQQKWTVVLFDRNRHSILGQPDWYEHRWECLWCGSCVLSVTTVPLGTPLCSVELQDIFPLAGQAAWLAAMAAGHQTIGRRTGT